MIPLAGGLFLGWAIGANDASNVFGTAVASRIVTFRNAAIICCLFVIAGAVLQGKAGIHTLSGLTGHDMLSLIVVSIAAGVTVTIMVFFRISISASQSILGAIMGVGLVTNSLNWHSFAKIATCWLITPFGAMLIACMFYKLFSVLSRKIPMSMLTRDKLLWAGLILVGAYGSYALGANNVANAVGIFSGQIPQLNDSVLALFGGIAIAAGVVSYGKRMMFVIGSGLMRLDAFTAFSAVFAMSITVHVFAFIGVPVSARQAIVGAIVGIGLMRGVHTIRHAELRNIGLGWILTPCCSLILSAAGYAIFSSVKVNF